MKDDKEPDLTEWRRKHRTEILTENYQTWKMIRDDPEASNKDRIEAAKNIARMAAVLSPETVSEKIKAKEDVPKRELTDKERAQVQELLSGISRPVS